MSTVPSMLGSGMKKMCDWLLRKLVQLICYIGEQYLSELEATGKWKKLSIGNLGSEAEKMKCPRLKIIAADKSEPYKDEWAKRLPCQSP